MTPIEWTAFITFTSDVLWKVVMFGGGVFVGYTIGRSQPPNA